MNWLLKSMQLILVESVRKTEYNNNEPGLGKKTDQIAKKIPHASGLVKKTDYNVKITENEGKILTTTGLATTALNDVENKISNVSDLVKKKKKKKKEYNAKISDKYFTTSGYNKFTSQILNAKIK